MNHHHRGTIVSFLSALLAGSSSLMLAKAECLDPAAIWCDEFNTPGVPNPEYWGYDLGGGGWGNRESQIYEAKNAVVLDDGFLHITAIRDIDGQYTSARIKTEDRVSFLYVRVEAAIRIPNVEGGLWPAIWMLGTNFADIGWPMCGEIDIAEWGSIEAIAENRILTTSSAAMHWDEDGHTFDFDEIVIEPPTMAEQFHIYAVDWTPTQINFFVDGAPVFSKNISDLEEFHKPFHMLVNVAVGGDYTGIYIPSSAGGQLLVDWIRVYDNGSGSNVTVLPCPDCDGKSGACYFGMGGVWIFGVAALVLSVWGVL